jgi:hypothetical protein
MEVSPNQTRGKFMSKISRISIDLSKLVLVMFGVLRTHQRRSAERPLSGWEPSVNEQP